MLVVAGDGAVYDGGRISAALKEVACMSKRIRLTDVMGTSLFVEVNAIQALGGCRGSRSGVHLFCNEEPLWVRETPEEIEKMIQKAEMENDPRPSDPMPMRPARLPV